MSEEMKWKCPKCGATNEYILGTAPAVVSIQGAVTDGEFQSWFPEDRVKPYEIGDFEKTVWQCPECEAEFHELESDQDLEDFIKKNAIQPELPAKNPNNPLPQVRLPSLFPEKSEWEKERKKQMKELKRIKGKGYMPGGGK